MSKEPSPKHRAAGGGVTHDQPVIITGGSVTIEFDDTDGPAHYIESAPSLYVGVGLKIESVSVREDPRAEPGSGTPCEGVPPHGLCTVIIQGRHERNGDDSPLRVRGLPGLVQIDFNGNHYRKDSGSATRKRHHSEMRRVESLKIVNNLTGREVNCTRLLPRNRKCFIDIIDKHIFGDLKALIEQREALSG